MPKIIQEFKGSTKFSITLPLTQSDTGEKGEGPTILEGLASNTQRSKTGHKMLPSAVQMMKEAARGLPFFINHDPDQVAGKIIDVKESSANEFYTISELLSLSGNSEVDAPVMKVLHWLDNGIRLGQSIGGNIVDAKLVEDDDGNLGWDIKAVQLLEVSVTPIPAVEETKGTLKKCPGGFCSQMVQHLNSQFDDEIKLDNDLDLEAGVMPGDNDLKQTVDSLVDIVKGLAEKEEARVKQEAETKLKEAQDAKEAELIQKAKEEAKQEVESMFTQFTQDLIKELRGDRNHTQDSEVIDEVIKQEVNDSVAPLKKIKQGLRDPVSYPAVMNGEMVQGMTPSELFGA